MLRIWKFWLLFQRQIAMYMLKSNSNCRKHMEPYPICFTFAPKIRLIANAIFTDQLTDWLTQIRTLTVHNFAGIDNEGMISSVKYQHDAVFMFVDYQHWVININKIKICKIWVSQLVSWKKSHLQWAYKQYQAVVQVMMFGKPFFIKKNMFWQFIWAPNTEPNEHEKLC